MAATAWRTMAWPAWTEPVARQRKSSATIQYQRRLLVAAKNINGNLKGGGEDER